MVCRHCGYQNMDTAHYCGGCGHKLMRKKSEGRNRRVWVAALLLIIVIIAGFVLTVGRKEKHKSRGIPIVDTVSAEITQVLPMENGVIAVLYTDGTVRISGDDSLANIVSEWEDVSKIDYTGFSALNNGLLLVGLTENGTVLTTEGSILDWNNVNKLYLLYEGIVGVTQDGQVLTYGTWKDDSFLTSLSDVEDLVYAGIQNIWGCLRKNGSVSFFDSYGYFEESDWYGVKELRDSGHGFYVIMNDGTVDGQIDDTYEGLTGAVKVVDHYDWVFGISEDGRLLTHNNGNISLAGGQLWVYDPNAPDYAVAEIDISQFDQVRDILAFNGLVLLNEDGSVEALCEGIDWDLSNWNNIQRIYGGDEWNGLEKPTLYGIRRDGTVIVVQREAYADEQTEQDNYCGWNLKEIYLGDGGVVGMTTDGVLVGDGAYANTDFSVLAVKQGD